uniref:C3H1-type domain-containing protein n=1 Tax=Trypanosoma congolense (strain IL3000) TaxID=1068625 RepID=G0UNY2_TRYCI|nr:conserved hypothetical protein [Trypanosoma congolense IL3000]
MEPYSVGSSEWPNDFESFLRISFPTHHGDFSTEMAVRVLVEYLGASHWECLRVVDAVQPTHNMECMKTYARHLRNLMQHHRGGELPVEVLPSADRNSSRSPKFTLSDRGNINCVSAPFRQRHGRKICRQFRDTGTCTFGSRCLYHHTLWSPGRESRSTASQGIVERSLDKTKLVKSAPASPPMDSNRTVLAEVPFSYNDGCPLSAGPSTTPQIGEGPVRRLNTSGTALLLQAVMTPLPAVYMVPFALPGGEFYGYTPIQLSTLDANNMTDRSLGQQFSHE